MKRKLIIVCSCVGILLLGALCYTIGMITDVDNPNYELMMNELKAKLRKSVHLDFEPDPDSIGELKVYGVIDPTGFDKQEHGDAVYTDKDKIQIITDYLNGLKLAEASDDELPNISADAGIAYYDNDGRELKHYIIYGQVFIKDYGTEKLYRIKTTSTGIIEGLEKLDFER